MASNLWTRKKEAFLAVLRQVLSGEECPSSVREAVEFSLGAGVPPFGPESKPLGRIHPLSGKKHPLGIDFSTSASRILTTAEKLAAGEDERASFLKLWRYLPEEAPEVWQVPAHFGQPLYNLFNAASLASAAAAVWPKPALVIFTLAGVQDFIAASRRTQDLWMGSFLLSWLSYQALREVAKQYGPDVVLMPQLWSQPLFDLSENLVTKDRLPKEKKRVANLPNIFSFLAPADEVEAIVARMKEALKRGTEEVFSAVQARLAAMLESPAFVGWEKTWERQKEAFLEELGVFWSVVRFPEREGLEEWLKKVWQPLDEAAKDYTKDNSQQRLTPEKICQLGALLPGERARGAVYFVVGRRTAELLSAAKLYRPFSSREEAGERCTLCGKRAALGGEAASYQELRQAFEALPQLFFHRRGGLKLAGRLRKGEALCAVCLTRRLVLECFFEDKYEIDHHLFPSTADLATASFKKAVLQNWEKVRDEVDTFLFKTDFLRKETGVSSSSLPALNHLADTQQKRAFLRLDGEWLFPESYDRERIKRVYGLELTADLLSEAQEALKRLFQKVKALEQQDQWAGVASPSRYYALIVADGDKMGELLLGKGKEQQVLWWRTCFLKEGVLPKELYAFPRLVTPHYHRFVAETLRRFAAEEAPQVTEIKALGRLIYAGGDDVFAVCALEDFPAVVRGLSQAYGRLFDGAATLSVAVVVAHHRTPFYLAVKEAQELLKKSAKEKMGRNAWAVQIMRRSGETTLFGAGFTENEENDVLYYFGKVLSHLREGRLSPRILTHLEPLSQGLEEVAPEAVKRLIRFLVERGMPENQQKKNQVAEDLSALFQAIFEMVEERRRQKENTSWEEANPIECFLAQLKGACFVVGREG